MTTSITKSSKFLSYVLRHKPDAIGLKLDTNGWADVDELLIAATKSGNNLTRSLLDEVVFTNDKQRFAYSPDGKKIRANQGHSLKQVALELEPVNPPETLYHGTVSRFLDRIRKDGLLKMNRQHVHLSPAPETAQTVGARRGKPVVLQVRAGEMYELGHSFYLSANGVWLVDSVPYEFIVEPDA